MTKLLITLLIMFLFSHAQTIRFAPLPVKPKDKLIGEHIPLIRYLEKKTGYRFEIVYFEDYGKLFENFRQGKVDLISAGPLPYIKLKKSFPHAKAIVFFKNEEGRASYSCVCFTSFEGPRSLRDVKGPVALPQKLSTCGYFSASIILSSAKKDIREMKYDHFETHDKVVQAVLSGSYQMGCVKKSVFKRYEGYALRVLGESPQWPEFALIANTQRLSPRVINRIREALLSIKPEEMSKLVEGRHGFAPVKGDEYRVLEKYEKHLPVY